MVEDEEEVRSLTRDVLEMHGYAVLEALGRRLTQMAHLDSER